ncbi:MAG TPA: BON domain-containing protein [Longimicrobiales bacterium]|nr:BON domain-containing protein [Longimicrobiales bacterium]
MNKSETLLIGMALGAGITYLLDPDRGTRRRALVRDQIVHTGHELEEAVRSNARHARNKARGLAHETRAALRETEVDDRVLEERVRSRIGRDASEARDLAVSADQGQVTLSGAVPPDDVQKLVRSTKSVRGVEAVENQLEAKRPSQERE